MVRRREALAGLRRVDLHEPHPAPVGQGEGVAVADPDAPRRAPLPGRCRRRAPPHAVSSAVTGHRAGHTWPQALGTHTSRVSCTRTSVASSRIAPSRRRRPRPASARRSRPPRRGSPARARPGRPVRADRLRLGGVRAARPRADMPRRHAAPDSAPAIERALRRRRGARRARRLRRRSARLPGAIFASRVELLDPSLRPRERRARAGPASLRGGRGSSRSPRRPLPGRPRRSAGRSPPPTRPGASTA